MTKRYFILLLVVFLISSISACSGKTDRIKAVFQKHKQKYLIYITKKNFLLEIYDRNSMKIAEYTIAYGENPDTEPKLHEGDNRTPEGEYHVNEILSMDSERNSDGYRKLYAMNKVYFRASQKHHKFDNPGVDLGDNAYGPRFFSINYPNEKDKVRYNENIINGKIKGKNGRTPGIGYGIGIHGNNDSPSIGHLASSGCIRMYNNDVIELDRYIQIGTPVIISHD